MRQQAKAANPTPKIANYYSNGQGREGPLFEEWFQLEDCSFFGDEGKKGPEKLSIKNPTSKGQGREGPLFEEWFRFENCSFFGTRARRPPSLHWFNG